MKKQFSKYFVAVLFFIIYTAPVIAGPGDDGDGMDEPDPLPIDSWVYVVLALAIAYAFYNFKNKKAICK